MRCSKWLVYTFFAAFLASGCVGELTAVDCPHEEAVSSGQAQLQVEPGLSCINCHVNGEIAKPDQRGPRLRNDGHGSATCDSCHNQGGGGFLTIP